jgi:hypothetical protein
MQWDKKEVIRIKNWILDSCLYKWKDTDGDVLCGCLTGVRNGGGALFFRSFFFKASEHQFCNHTHMQDQLPFL